MRLFNLFVLINFISAYAYADICVDELSKDKQANIEHQALYVEAMTKCKQIEEYCRTGYAYSVDFDRKTDKDYGIVLAGNPDRGGIVLSIQPDECERYTGISFVGGISWDINVKDALMSKNFFSILMANNINFLF